MVCRQVVINLIFYLSIIHNTLFLLQFSVIGGWANSKSVIRCSRQGKSEVEHKEKNVLHPKEYRLFVLEFDGSVIRVFKGGEVTPFMEFSDDVPFKVNYIGISTGWGSAGDWIFFTVEFPKGGSKHRHFLCVSWHARHNLKSRNLLSPNLT